MRTKLGKTKFEGRATTVSRNLPSLILLSSTTPSQLSVLQVVARTQFVRLTATLSTLERCQMANNFCQPRKYISRLLDSAFSQTHLRLNYIKMQFSKRLFATLCATIGVRHLAIAECHSQTSRQSIQYTHIVVT